MNDFLVGIPLMHDTKEKFCVSLEIKDDIDCLGGYMLFVGTVGVWILGIKV
jgi:hypothetical protein